MKVSVSILTAIMVSTASLAFASERPQTPSENPNVLFQIEVPGHLADGLHEIISVVQEGGLASVVKAEGSYKQFSGDHTIDYKETVLASNLRCTLPSDGKVGISCRRDDRPVDGALTIIEVNCSEDPFSCSATRNTTWVDMRTGKTHTKSETLLNYADRVI